MKQLEEEADQLWAPQKAKRRVYYQARDRLEEAQSRQREHSLSVNAWRAARKALGDAEKRLLQCRQEHEDTSKELKKLVRIRRVHGAIRRRRELRQRIDTLGDVIVLAEDAAEQFSRAEQQEAKIRAQVDILAPQLQEAQKALEGITFDEAFVRRADEIAQLNEQRIAVRSGREDLPKRRDEYRLELESLGRLAAEIGWEFGEPSELIERIPPRSRVDSVRRLSARHGELAAELRSARKAFEVSQAAFQDKTERLDEIGEATDISGLEAVLKVVREIGDVAGRIRTAKGQLDEIGGGIETKLGSMKPVLPAGAEIEGLLIPPRDTIIAHRDDVRKWTQREDETKRRLTETRNDLERDQEALERRVRDEGIVAPGAVEEARGYRDTLWRLVKARYIACSEIPAEEAEAYGEVLDDLPISLEEAIEQADSIADRRFDKAQAAGELAVLARNIAGHETRIGQLEAEETALKAEGDQLDRDWQTLWADVPIEALAPDVMLAWLQAREDIVALIGRERDVRRQLADSRKEEQEGTAQLRAALTTVGCDGAEIEANELRVLVERAEAYRREQEAKAEKIVEMRAAARTAKSEMVQRQVELEEAQVERVSWQADWGKAVAAIDLQCDEKTEVVSAQINVIEEIREHAATAKDLRDKRIATIERDIGIFQVTVAEIVTDLAPDLADGDAETSAVALDRRREVALKLHQKNRELTVAEAERRREIEDLEEDRKAGWISIRPLMETAGVEDAEELRKSIEGSDRLRVLKEELASVMETLDQQGEGLAIEVIEEECRGC